MLTYALLLFVVAALGGVALAGIRVQRNANPPLALAAIHGLAAALGLVLLLAANAQLGFAAVPALSLGLLVVAAVGGFVLLASHLRGRTIGLPLVGAHAAAAVGGFVLLALAWFTGA